MIEHIYGLSDRGAAFDSSVLLAGAIIVYPAVSHPRCGLGVLRLMAINVGAAWLDCRPDEGAISHGSVCLHDTSCLFDRGVLRVALAASDCHWGARLWIDTLCSRLWCKFL